MRIALVSMSAGSGHIRAAKAIESYAHTYTNHAIMHIDAARCIHPVFAFFNTKAYAFITERLPKLWGFLYRVSDTKYMARIYSASNGMLKKSNGTLHATILSHNPDAIVCTHFGSVHLLKSLAAERRIPLYLVITDYTAHALYVMDYVSGYFVPTEQVKQQLRMHGVAEHKIHVTGIPTDPVFYTKKNKQELQAKYGISAQSKMLLIIAKTYPTHTVARILDQVADISNLHIFIIGAKSYSYSKKNKAHLQHIGLTTDIDEYMRVADAVISKSGGLTSTECMTLGAYMVIYRSILGQETANARYMEKNGYGILCEDIKKIGAMVGARFTADTKPEYPKILRSDEHPAKKILDTIRARETL